MVKFLLWLFLFVIVLPNSSLANERTEEEALRDLKKGAGYLGAAVVCKEYNIAEMANQHLKYLQTRDTIAGIFHPDDEAFLIQMQKETSQKVREDFLSNNSLFSCSELPASFESFRKETRPYQEKQTSPFTGVADNYDLKKRDPLYAQAMEGLRTRTMPSQNTGGPSLGWADGIDMLALSVALFAAGFVAWRVSHTRRVPPVSTFSTPLIFCLIFIFLRGTIDTYMGVSGDNALNFVMGAVSLVLILMICSPTRHENGLLWGGLWMSARGLLNIGLFIWMGSDNLAEMLTTMPISALPNFIISYVLPFVVAGYLIKTYRKKTQAI